MAYLNPYLNFHRPCGFALLLSNARSKGKRVYRHQDYHTSYEKLRSLPEWEKYLKEGLRRITLEWQALRMSDTHAAQQMRKTKLELLSWSRTRRGERN
ncbi:MAG: hypothetical protein LC130_14970 [Bryobacterales bacterium]|nr:hypothetical protein [Bryobacterales bacterium]MEB2363597.1 hypothetical protein [Bryobacterales bacterium]